ncbi:MAG: T9SS type A sorting domain-containing protein [Bacteroidales bacterium]|nr:T9SS type A sorting domain-containing protein [Bacteroidales bacterium]
MKNKLLIFSILFLSLLFNCIQLNAQNISDFLVNEQGSLNGAMQSTPSIGGDGSGNFVITWQDRRNGLDNDIFAQIHLKNDTITLNNFKVNDETGIIDQIGPTIAVNQDLNFVIAWAEKKYNTWTVYAQRFSGDGTALGNNFKVNDDEGIEKKNHISVTIDSCANFVITWADLRNDDWDIYTQHFSNEGTAIGDNVKINDDSGNALQLWPASVCDKSGNLVVSWADCRNNNGREIFAQRFLPDGTPLGNNFKVNTDLYGNNHILPDIAMDANSNFIIVWEDNRNGYPDIFAQRYLSDGTAIDDNFKINNDVPNTSQRDPSVSCDFDGNFIVSWDDNRFDYHDVFARRFSNDGTPLDNEFKVNDDYTNYSQFNAVVSSDANGNFFICWEDGRFGYKGDIFYQKYLNDGTLVDINIKLNDDTKSENQADPSIAVDENENFIITWADCRSGNNEIFAQQFTSDGVAIEDNFKVSDSPDYGCIMPSIAISNDGKFVITWGDCRNGYCYDIYAQLFSNDATPIGDNFRVSYLSACMNFNPKVVFKNNGEFIITWSDADEGSFDKETIHHLNKKKIQDIIFNNDSKSCEPDVYFQLFSGDGTPIGENVLVNDDIINTYQSDPSIAVDTNDNFIITWQDNRNGPWHIYLQRFLSDGTPVGENFTAEDILYLANQICPSISFDNFGRFTLAWSDFRYNNHDVFCRSFLNDGTPLGESFQVNDISVNSYYLTPQVSARANGDFIIAWADFRNGSNDIFAQRYFNDGQAFGNNYQLTEADDMQQLIPSLFFGNDRIFTCWQDNRGGQTGLNVMANIKYWDKLEQEIFLEEGYQFISSNIIPVEADMLLVMTEILGDNLSFVRNSQGQTLQKIGPNWVNGIGEWIFSEGYLVKMLADDSFSIDGSVVDPTTPIPVEQGFQFVSYFPQNPMDALLAFATIMNDDLDYIRNTLGQTLRKIGPIWVNGIGDSQHGEGYLVKMFANGEITYPASEKTSDNKSLPPTHFIFEGGNAADPLYTLYIKGLEIGDEVAAYDGDKLVGAIKIASNNIFDNSLPVFSTLNNSKGYSAGSPIKLKVWDSKTDKILEVKFNMEIIYESFVSDNYPFEDGKYSIVNVLKDSMTSDEEILVFPNPATESISIISQNEIIKVSIFNCSGQSVYEKKINEVNIQINTSDFDSGIYIIRIETINGLETHKVRFN